jgi:ribose transport system substrate-binding protein
MELSHKRKGIIIAALLAASAGLTSCSDSQTDDPGSDTSEAAATVGTDYDLAAVTAEVDTFTTRPTSIGVDAPLVGAIPADKTIAYIQCGAPACVESGDFLESATDAVGWKLERIDAGVTAESVKAAWQQAVETTPDGVVASGFPRVLFDPELAQLADMGIPVINQITADEPGNGLSLVLAGTADQEKAGKRIADYMLAQNNGDAFPVLSVTTSAYASLLNTQKGMEAEFKKVCPDCKVDGLDVPVTSIGGDLPTRITSYLSSHPDVKWVWNGFSDMSSGLPAALKAANLNDVKVVSYDSSPTIQSYLDQGQAVVAIDAYPAPEMMWRSIDYFIRTMNGEDTSPDEALTLPEWIVTQDTLPSASEPFPLVEDYQEQFKALWNLN